MAAGAGVDDNRESVVGALVLWLAIVWLPTALAQDLGRIDHRAEPGGLWKLFRQIICSVRWLARK